jgi:hypothetical protein
MRRWLAAVLVGCVVTGCGAPAAPAPNPTGTPEKMNGMTEAGYQPTVFQGPGVIGQLPRLKRDGVTWLALQEAWFQKTNASTTIAPSPQKTPTDGSVTRLIRVAQAMGFHVFLNPFVNSFQGSGWQALFAPRSVPAWFQSYDRYLVHYARLAQQDHVALFSIGDEFDSLDDVPAYRPYWLHAIALARRYYHGPIVYGADYTHYQRVTFWSALDAVGIDAYFPLASSSSPTLSQLEARWRQIAAQIEAWRVRSGLSQKPFIITELGYPSEDTAAEQPGTWYPREPVNLRLQQLCYEATLQTIYREPWVQGIFWFWWANPSNPDWQGGPDDNGYTPRGKPAEITLRRYFTGAWPIGVLKHQGRRAAISEHTASG